MDCRDMDFYEDYESPFDFNTGVNKNYLYLSPSGNSSPPGSPTLQKFDLLRTDPVPEEGEDVAAAIGAPETLSEEEQEELRRELAKVEEEIQTLSQVLAAKEKHLAEIKRKLGINSLQELKQNLAKGWQDVTATSAYVPSIIRFYSEYTKRHQKPYLKPDRRLRLLSHLLDPSSPKSWKMSKTPQLSNHLKKRSKT
ncbi:PREDICTED: tumor protein D52 isoform X2 [Ceratotherium simum simum]|uniref:Tumor protein D52 isoform X2 n=1 Tax=Ceratotherium simum simum TaxID=73337 RepID=A0ABM1CLP0_CERSS|nr:PREDICTED: tumor protein D52 isoform X2 [Ceratotherium simum simum]